MIESNLLYFILPPKEFISEDLSGGTAGRAIGSCHDYVKIQVDETIFRNLTTGEQIFLMYHELGHQVMNYSIMTPTEVGLSNASSYYKTDDIYDAYVEDMYLYP